METTLRKVGNSLGVIIPKKLIDDLHLKNGDKLNLSRDGNIIQLSISDNDFEEWAEAYRQANMEYKDVLKELAK